MAIITLQHHDRGVPGRLGMTLRDHGFKLDVRRVDLPRDKGGKPVPTDLDDAHGLIILGGPQNVTDPLPWIQEEQALIRAAHARQIPIIGICLGCQQIAAALGGEVGPMASPELGMTRVALNTIGQVEPMLGGIAWDSMQFQSHAYEVKKIPPGATLLASSKACNVQAFRAGLRTFAFQYHFECDLGAIESYLAADKDDLAKVGLTPAQALDDARRAYEMFARLADRLCVNLATFAFPVVKKLSA